ncbi:MAG: polyprenyl synthetase family protein [Treponema sp.]|uniref:FPP/GGPP synthase family protein n=1 Tax=Treponema sp. TaxID=166 RepID=UPI00257F7BE8|nr:polyprenyl synthetase family protein [Treponema sp.]MBQ9101755.1 polyprenyl synthetase family protein [Treponema sp.]
MKQEFTSRLEKIELSLQKFLPQELNDSWKELSFGKIDSCINQEHISVLTQPCAHLVSLGGKRWRPLLLVLCAQMTAQAKKTDVDLTKAYGLTPLVEFAHTASLIHDDIEDGADTRRGKPCAHISYGMDVAINAGSWLYFEATTAIKALNLSSDEKLRLYELFLQELRLLHLGQAMDIKWHRNPDLIPSIEEYTAMVRNKTGTLARLAVKLGILAGGGTDSEIEEAGKIAQDIGVAFQIIDDVKNLTTGNPGKKRGDDIVEGKKSLPVLLHLQKNPQDEKILAQYFTQAKNEEIESPAVEKAIQLLTQSGAVEQAAKKGSELVTQKSQELALLYGTKTEIGTLIEELFNSMR